MYFFYIDESGNTGRALDSPEQPIHWLIGVGVEATRLPSVERDLRDLARHYCPTEARDPDFEFHGSAIFHGRRPFDHLTPQKRVDLYDQLLSVVPRHDVKVFVRGIHKKRHRDRAARKRYSPDHPHRLGFMFLVERIDRWLEENQPGGPETRRSTDYLSPTNNGAWSATSSRACLTGVSPGQTSDTGSARSSIW